MTNGFLEENLTNNCFAPEKNSKDEQNVKENLLFENRCQKKELVSINN